MSLRHPTVDDQTPWHAAGHTAGLVLLGLAAGAVLLVLACMAALGLVLSYS